MGDNSGKEECKCSLILEIYSYMINSLLVCESNHLAFSKFY